MSWTKDNLGFFYSRFPEPAAKDKKMDETAGQETDKLQFSKVYYHRVGTQQSADVLVFEDGSKPDYMFAANVSNCGKYLMLDTRKDCDDLGLVSYASLDGVAIDGLL
jgi:prolyl oligopeptidase